MDGGVVEVCVGDTTQAVVGRWQGDGLVSFEGTKTYLSMVQASTSEAFPELVTIPINDFVLTTYYLLLLSYYSIYCRTCLPFVDV